MALKTHEGLANMVDPCSNLSCKLVSAYTKGKKEKTPITHKSAHFGQNSFSIHKNLVIMANFTAKKCTKICQNEQFSI